MGGYPDRVVTSAEQLTGLQRRIVEQLFEHRDDAFPMTTRRLGLLLGVSRTAANNHLRHLESLGIVRAEKRNRSGFALSRYVIRSDRGLFFLRVAGPWEEVP